MDRTLYLGGDDFAIKSAFDPVASGVVVNFDDPMSARCFLERFLLDPQSVHVLRDIVTEGVGGFGEPALDDHDVIDLVAQRVYDRHLRLVRLPAVVVALVGFAEEAPPEKAAPAPEKAWVEIKVIDDRTNRPVPRIRIMVTLPDGSEASHTTNADGLVTIDPVSVAGSCGIASSADDLRFESTLDFVGLGDGPVDEGSDDPWAKSSTTFRIALVEHHKVRTGETLDGLAKTAGLSWKQLAKFNFGVDDPAKINECLRTRVGCIAKTRDGMNYVFSDSDEPGLIYIPRRLERSGLWTGQTHVLRVRPLVRRVRRFLFSW